MKIIHLTDTHFVPKGERLYGRDPRVALDAAVRDINTHHADADLAVITGDLSHWGEAEAFAQLADVLDDLSMPLRLLIGNHDDRETFAQAFPDQPRDRDDFIQSTLDTATGLFIFLDTNLPGTHAGHYCPRRLAWLADTLAAHDGRDVFLFMHHPPFATGLPAVDAIGLQERTAFQAVVEPHKARIRHLFFGHVHRPIAGSWLSIPMTSLRAMNHQVWFDMTAETDIPGSFEPPAYCVALIEDDRVVVHYHDFLDDSPKFSLHDSPWDDWSRRHPHP